MQMELCEGLSPSGDSPGAGGDRLAPLTLRGARALVTSVLAAFCPSVLGGSDDPLVTRGVSLSSSDEEMVV